MNVGEVPDAEVIARSPADVAAMLSEHETWSASPQRAASSRLLGADPPEHTRLREVLAATMLMAQRNLGEPAVREVIDGILREASHVERVDGVRDIAARVSTTSLARLLGMPVATDWDNDGAWRHRMVALQAINGQAPPTTVLGMLGAAVWAGRLSKAEAIDAYDILVIGGLHTTTTLLAAVIVECAQEAGRSNEELLGLALRHYPPLRWQLRARRRDGALGLADVAQALKDGAPISLAFGSGVHRCVGEAFARLQALALLRALKGWQVTLEGELTYADGRILQVHTLPMRIEARH
jgi:cytochrome P450